MENEKKYLVRNQEIFQNIIDAIPARIFEYVVANQGSLFRPYRYFDAQEILEQNNFAVSVRHRLEKGDSILTIKFPHQIESRYEYDLSIEDVSYDQIDPNDFALSWPYFNEILKITKGRLLQEVVQLEVRRRHFNLYCADQWKIQIAADEVLAHGSGRERTFYELEIEVEEYGSDEDKKKVGAYFEQKYGPALVQSSLPKWVKALRLLRGEEIKPD